MLRSSVFISIIILFIIYFSPIFWRMSCSSIDFGGIDSYFYNSILFAFISSLAIPFLSLFVAFYLFRFKSNLSVFLLLPFLLGSVSVAFIFKSIFFDFEYLKVLIFENSLISYLFLFFTQLWQFGSLYVFLFYTQSFNFNTNPLIYLQSINAENKFINRDYYFKESRPLLNFLIFVTFIFCYNESAVSSVALGSSDGLQNEMVTSALYKFFKTNLNYSIELAISQTFWKAGLYLILALSGLMCTSFFITTILDWALKSQKTLTLFSFFRKSKSFFQKAIISIVTFIILIPIFWPFFLGEFSFSSETMYKLVWPLILTILTGFFVTIFSTVIAIKLRMDNNKILDSINNKSLRYFTLMFIFLLIPPVIILINAFAWSRINIFPGEVFTYLMWVTGHLIFTAPLLICFSLLSLMKYDAAQIDYIKSTKPTYYENLKINFFPKFKNEFFLTFLMSISIIWNEGTINRVFSDSIPSFITILYGSLTGKGANYSLALFSYIISIIIAVLCILVLKNTGNLKINTKNA